MRAFIVPALLPLLAKASFADLCNPLTSSCPPNPALRSPVKLDFSEETDLFSNLYGSDRTSYTASGGLKEWFENHGDGPSIRSNFYALYGRFEIECQIPEGTGIVLNFFLQLDTGDEIDFEWLSSKPSQVQTNYFGKEVSGNYDRGETTDLGIQLTSLYHKFTIEWREDQISWFVDGKVIRTLKRTNVISDGQHDYPVSPMRVYIGMWAAGDSENPGVAQWAGEPTSTNGHPLMFNVKYFSAVNYSPAISYTYVDKTGNRIIINGGTSNADVMEPLPISYTTPTVSLLTSFEHQTATAAETGISNHVEHAVSTSSGSSPVATNESSTNGGASTESSVLGLLVLVLGGLFL